MEIINTSDEEDFPKYVSVDGKRYNLLTGVSIRCIDRGRFLYKIELALAKPTKVKYAEPYIMLRLKTSKSMKSIDPNLLNEEVFNTLSEAILDNIILREFFLSLIQNYQGMRG
ncbi:MAG: hypothetical protein ARM1_0807 [Candidatus Micrarchaeota archaeon]|nr:MAG: hypothetical protein ARM1_0807 [Candidatus Micrarchaeota archaeon]